jgi:chromosome segregation ATPase
MLVDLPQDQILYIAGAFLIGWILSAVRSRMTASFRANKRDPRDDRIRSLEAEARIAQSDAEAMSEKDEVQQKELMESNEGIEKRDNVIAHQQGRLEELAADLKASVKKTRELRTDLSDRATENLRSELKIREVETELDIAQASTDMIATGVLDYALTPELEPAELDPEANDPDYGKTAT